jgi:mannose-6-phosphate isomerase-like protein (cupin superfamily)
MRITPWILLLVVGACSPAKGDARIVPATAVATAAAAVSPDTSALLAGGTALDVFTAAQLSSAAAQIARGTSTATVLARRPDRYYVEARRVANGVPEVHDDFSDVTFVQAGRAVLHTGATVRGSHVESAGEHRGGTIDGGARRAIAAGDFFVIPPGAPHQYEVAAGDSIRYLTVKVRKSR